MPTIITTNKLSRRFGTLTAVDSLTLEVNEGEVVGLLGHNGAGKTTTVRLLNGLLAPSGGSILVAGLDPVMDGPALRMLTGVLTETPSLDNKLTARENLAIFGSLYLLSKSDISERSNALLETFNLTHRADDRIGTYSKGMRQRLALARVLLHNPKLLFLDEPTSGLDPVAARQVRQTITQLKQDNTHTIVLCTHNLAEAQMLCDKVAVLEQGQLMAFGPPQSLAQNLSQGVKVQIEFDIDNSDNTIHDIQALLGMHSLIGADNALIVWLSSRTSIPDVVNTLVAKGMRILRVDPQEPSLEDVYFALHEVNHDKSKEVQ
jgi:ABC-2 type transport system ATP-binding protein